MGTDRIYQSLISSIKKLPIGVLRWSEELTLTEQQLRTSLTFAKLFSKSVFDQVFQHKIVTQILPTNKYLSQYQIVDSDLCSRCLASTDTAYHNPWLCASLTSYLSTCFEFLRDECNLVDTITVEKYLLGFSGMKMKGVNHILLGLKKTYFL